MNNVVSHLLSWLHIAKYGDVQIGISYTAVFNHMNGKHVNSQLETILWFGQG